MSQSFEKKVGSRLQHYEPSPPKHLKSKVFEAVNPSRGLNGWQVTGIVLLVMSLFFWMQNALPGSEYTSENASTSGSKQVVQEEEKRNQKQVDLYNSKEVERTIQQRKAQVSHDPSLTQTSTIAEESSNARQPRNEAVGAADVDFSREDLLVWEIEGRSTYFRPAEVGGLALRPNRKETIVFTKEVVKPKRVVPFYMESGLFFLYQQAFPNMEDQLVITDFMGAAGLSPKRIGIFLETGFHLSPFKKLRLHVGAKLNTFQQSYQFAIRGFAADSVEVLQSGDEVVFNPVFDQNLIVIDHRLFGAGLVASFNWKIFPSYTNELVTSIEHVQILNRQQSFQYDDKSYTVGYSNQTLLSIGMRKILIENEKGMLQIHPSLRYSLNSISPSRGEVLSMKPYSVGVSFSYILGNFRK